LQQRGLYGEGLEGEKLVVHMCYEGVEVRY